METNYIKHTNNAKKYQKQIDNIKAKYPEINIFLKLNIVILECHVKNFVMLR